MKKDNMFIVGICSCLFAVFVFWWMFLQMISPGYVGVVVNKLGGPGVESNVLGVGLHWVAPWKSVYEFPVFEQNHTWENKDGFSFQTSEGLAVHADVGITYHLRTEKVADIFQKYRRGMYEISHIFIHNCVRDAINTAASKMKIEDLYGTGKERFFKTAEDHVRQDLGELGIEISRIYLIGRFHFPDSVVSALNAKIEAIQRAQQRENELREAEAQANKHVAAARGDGQAVLAHAESQAKARLLLAEAEAQSNRLINASLSENLIEWQRIQRWDGKLPHVTGGVIPMLEVK